MRNDLPHDKSVFAPAATSALTLGWRLLMSIGLLALAILIKTPA